MGRTSGLGVRGGAGRGSGQLRVWIFVAVSVAVVVLLAYAVAFVIDEPLRRYTEAKVNRALKGYTVRIDALDFHPHNLSLDLKGLTITQNEHPDPPVMHIPVLRASVHWRALVHGRVVGDMFLDRPEVHMNVVQLRKEIADPTPIEERGWQEALEGIYPLEVNQFRVRGGDITYQDQGPFRPLRLRHVNAVATNIRNVRSQDRTYPSEFQVTATVFDSGHVTAEGRADLLAEPNPTFTGSVDLERIELDYFKPVMNRYNVSVNKGLLSASGQFESRSQIRRIELTEARIDDANVDYVHMPQTAAVEEARVSEAVKAAEAASNAPDVRLKIARLHVNKSTFGYVNETTTPPFRVFMTDVDVTLTNVTNQKAEGRGAAKIEGKFMGSGSAVVDLKSRAETSGPALDVSVRITDVNLAAMNDLLRAYGHVDVASGQFAFYSEVAVRHGVITGYVKPLFKDVAVSDPEKDKDKSIAHKMYETVVGAVATLLKNRSRGEVATRAQVSGRLDDPKVSAAEVIIHLIQNAFFKAILPGLERETGRTASVTR
jgi:uncharacterized protein DUF748